MGFLSSPGIRIARGTLDEKPGKLPFVAVVNGHVGLMGRCDEKLGIKDPRFAILDILDCDGLQMMNVQPRVDLVSRNPKIAALIPKDYEPTNLFPLVRAVEELIEVSVRAEGDVSDAAEQLQITKPLFEGCVVLKF